MENFPRRVCFFPPLFAPVLFADVALAVCLALPAIAFVSHSRASPLSFSRAFFSRCASKCTWSSTHFHRGLIVTGARIAFRRKEKHKSATCRPADPKEGGDVVAVVVVDDASRGIEILSPALEIYHGDLTREETRFSRKRERRSRKGPGEGEGKNAENEG